MKLTENQKRWLTEGDKKNKMLDECWHEWKKRTHYLDDFICKKCGLSQISSNNAQRTFTEPRDFFAVVRALDIGTASAVFNAMTSFDNEHNQYWFGDLVELMQELDFIEQFMVEVCKMEGIK